ncbi:alpha/beta hydrolase [Variovorax sp. JS1663]|uniref:alpha/beta hydrolase n=1 Tax=Variovorax sp. JS1663 TaxID=1851577 RepID=UPI000B347742|nr:alpha/beta hydrolase [Variovorax sp. JS1663]OUM04438.1 esterase [Variovorax sp. JS1663]
MRRLIMLLAAALAIASSLGGCSAVGTLNALSARGDSMLSAGVAYGELPRQKLDIYTPAGMAPAHGWPVVVFFYGGSWNTGARQDYEFVGRGLAARGVLVLIADYRLYPEVRYPQFLEDSARALAFGLEHAARLGGDPRRVFVMGHSAGGYNAAMLALDARWLGHTGHAPRELAGWIGLAGPYDFLPTGNPEVRPVFFHPNYPPHAQPIEFASRSAPRTFLGAAVDDALVSPDRSTRQLARKLETAGVPVTLRLYERARHTTLIGAFAWPLGWIAPVLEDVQAFIDAAGPTSASPHPPSPG